MLRFTSLCLWIMIMILLGTYGCAASKPDSLSPVQGTSTPVYTGKLAEAETLSKRVQELLKAGDYTEALYLAQRNLGREKLFGESDPYVATSLIDLGDVRSGMGYPYIPFPLYQRALKIREKALGPDHPETAAILRRLANQYRRIGSYAQALPLAQRSLNITEKVLGKGHQETAASMDTLAGVLLEMGSYEQALPLAQQSLTIREKELGPEHLDTSYSLYTLGMFYYKTRSLQQALSLAQRSLQIRERHLGTANRDYQYINALLGYLYLKLKDYPQSEAHFRRTAFKEIKAGLVEYYLATGRPDAALENLPNLTPWSILPLHAHYHTLKGLAFQELGRMEEAGAAFLEAINFIEDLRTRTPGERSGFFEAGLHLGHSRAYKGMVAVLAELAQRGENIPAAWQSFGKEPGMAALYFAEAIKGRALLEAMVAEASKTLSEQLPSDLKAKEKSLQDHLAYLEGRREEDFTDYRLLQSGESKANTFILRRNAFLKKQEEFVSELRRRVPRYAALYYPQPYKAEELPLKPGEILLEYTLGDKESYLFRVEPGGKTKIFRLALGQEALEERLGRLLASFRQGDLGIEDLRRFPLIEAAALYKELLEPALAELAPGTRLIIVPDGVLGAFPFEALAVQAGRDWSDSVLVADRWPVTYAQSAAILALNRHLQASHADKPLFALGDCIYEKDSPRYLAYKSGQGQAGELKHLGPEKALTMAATQREWGRLLFPPLPETRQTIQDLAQIFGVPCRAPQVLMDVQATETEVRKAILEKYRYLFFGTHGFLADKMSGVQEPVLVLTQVENKPPDDGFLTFSKVLQLKLDAEVVTLAACMTGVGQVMQGEGVLNFARAFQQAGARSVMVALWNIPVEESLKFYHTFYQALKEGKTRLQALQAARQAVRAKEPHPYFWSGLILHGEG